MSKKNTKVPPMAGSRPDVRGGVDMSRNAPNRNVSGAVVGSNAASRNAPNRNVPNSNPPSNAASGETAGPREGKFLSDVKALRDRARKHIEDGAVTSGYRANRETVVKLLNDALATEIVCVLRYRRHYFMASGINAEAVAQEFLAHANEEQGHADLIAARIIQLKGEPNFDPASLTSRSHAEYVEGNGLRDMIKENLIAERIAIESYTEMVQYIGDKDSTTRRMLEGILAMEEEHADDLSSLLEELQGS